MVPNIDIDIPDIDINIENTDNTNNAEEDDDDNDEEGETDDDSSPLSDDGENSWINFYYYFQEKILSIFSNFQFIIGIGAVAGIIIIGIIIVRQYNKVKEVVSENNLSTMTGKIKDKVSTLNISKDTLKNNIKNKLSKE